MTLVDEITDAWQREGLTYLITEAPGYLQGKIKNGLHTQLSKLYTPYGTIGREQLQSVSSDTWYYGTETELKISQPLTAQLPRRFQSLVGTHYVPPSFVCELSRVRLTGDRALCQTMDGKYVLEEMGTNSMLKSRVTERYSSLSYQERMSELSRPIFSDPIDDDYDLLVNMVPRHGGEHNNFVNYGHWIAEDLPRLRGYEQYCRNTGREPTPLLKNDPPSWMVDTLELLGFSSSDWIEWDQDEAIVSRLVIPKLSYVHSIGSEFQPSDREWVSNRLKSGVEGLQEGDFPERVFLSRQGQPRRHVDNFEEVMEAMRSYGFEAVRPEEHSIKDQIRLFHQAEMLVGPSGSGLVNQIFATDASVVELKPENAHLTVWYILANENDLQYDYLRGTCPGLEGADASRNFNIVVDISKLIEIIENIID